jgi:GNAT superfamily N-acetyltransferase
MLNDRTIAIAQRYWAQHLGCEPQSLFTDPVRAIQHGGELAGYEGVFALFREGRVVLSMPHDGESASSPPAGMMEAFQGWLSRQDLTPDSLVRALEPLAGSIIGPAFIGYAESVAKPDPAHTARPLDAGDAAAMESLKTACDPTEWDHGGSPTGHACSGVFVEGQLAALAGYEIWGGAIAHICIVTHPGHRGKGCGRSAVAHLARRAIEAGLLPQYRTGDSNTPSIRIAESLGFTRYATSVAMRFADHG